MADTYIDYLECGEYGDHFAIEAKKLIGVSPLVNVQALIDHIETKKNAVDAELEKQGIKRSDARVNQKDVKGKADFLRKEIRKFHSYLDSLDDEVIFDHEAFFKGGNLGDLAKLKPADVAQRARDILYGFSVSANENLPGKDTRAKKISDALMELSSALSGKSSSAGQTIQGTAALVAAREEFLKAYNKVAKRLIRGLLTSLGREDELKLFFKDLTVNEGSKSSKEAGGVPDEQAESEGEGKGDEG